MSGSGSAGKSRGHSPSSKGQSHRNLSHEEEALWDAVTETYEPLKRGKPRVARHEAAEAPKSTAARPAVPPRQPAAPTRPHPAIARTLVRPPASAPATKPPPLADFDKRKAKKIAAGREAIDARIDLHGMRQSEAHIALRSFILSCYSNGLRILLVITGKGGPARDEDAPGSSFMDTRERGVLKKNVPMWLAEPDLRAIVISYRNAAPTHGGAGALYLHLRSQRRGGGRD